MRFTIRQKTLLKEVELLRSVASRKAKDKNNPLLRCILLKADEAGLILSATDTEVSITTTCAVEPLTVVIPGAIAVPAAKLSEDLKSFGDVVLDIELLANDRLQINHGRDEFKIACEKADKFPDTPRPIDYPASVPSSILLGQIIRTQFAIPNELSQAPKGILLTAANNVMSMLALDGNQCALVESNITFPASISAVVPKAGIEELAKLLDDVREAGDEIIGIAKDENHIFFKVGDREMVSRLIATPFPNPAAMYARFTGDAHQTMIALVEQFSKTLQGVANMSDDKLPRVLLTIDDGEMKISAQSDEGEAKKYLKVASNGLKAEISFDTRYLIPCLSAMKGDKVQIDIINSENPALLTSLDEENFVWRTVVMPLRPI